MVSDAKRSRLSQEGEGERRTGREKDREREGTGERRTGREKDREREGPGERRTGREGERGRDDIEDKNGTIKVLSKTDS